MAEATDKTALAALADAAIEGWRPGLGYVVRLRRSHPAMRQLRAAGLVEHARGRRWRLSAAGWALAAKSYRPATSPAREDRP